MLLPVRAANPRKSPIRGLLFSPFGGLQVYLPMFHQTFDLDGLDEALMSVVIEGASAPITAKVRSQLCAKQSSNPYTQYLEALHMRVFNTLGDVIGNYSTYAGSMSIQATKGYTIAGYRCCLLTLLPYLTDMSKRISPSTKTLL